MTKKSSRKKRRKQRKPNVPVYTPPVESEETETVAPAVPAAPASAPAVSNASKRTPTSIHVQKGETIDSIDWAAEYPYVMGDLRSMGIVALAMVVLLVALNFILS